MKKTSMYYNKDSEAAVSPIVATLVLIVVAVVGAVAVGTIMGTFSTDVSKKTNAGDASSASSNELLIAGSTTVYPGSVNLAKDYESRHPGMKITVQQGGSGAGVTSAAMSIVDIGASSSLATITDAKAANLNDKRYQDLQYKQIGGSGIVIITGGTSVIDVTASDLKTAYANANSTGYITTGYGNIPANTHLFQRQDVSGTEETFATYINGTKTSNVDWSLATQKSGNEGILAAVQGEANSLGFVDYGYTVDSNGAQVSGIKIATADNMTGTSSHIKAALKDMMQGKSSSTSYPIGLVRGLYYITEGTPNSVVGNFINYASSPDGAVQLDKAGMFGITEFA